MHPTEDVCTEEVEGGRSVRRRSVWPVEFWRWWSPHRESSSSELGDARSEHLIIFVNGINGSANDWRFAAEQFKKKFGDKVIVFCSSKNSSKRTYDGIEIMGRRLADEVRESVRESKPRGVTKISFVAHSLGGLIARYAIAVLMYLKPGGNGSQQIPTSCNTYLPGTIEGLEPVNFITVATPHLGSRGNQYLPFLFGIPLLEKVAPYVAHWFVGETGRHLFLADRHKAQEPLLLRMVEDGDELKFMSAFEWNETGYKHIQDVVDLRVQDLPEPKSKCEEDRMVSGLRRVQWRRVYVSFINANFKYLTHNTIQVKWHFIHREGADVIRHICDQHF